MRPRYFLGIDQGTSGSRALILDAAGQVCGYGYRPLASLHPQPGWVEQEPHIVARTVAEAMTLAVADAGIHPRRNRRLRHRLPAQYRVCVGCRDGPAIGQRHYLAGFAHGRFAPHSIH